MFCVVSVYKYVKMLILVVLDDPGDLKIVWKKFVNLENYLIKIIRWLEAAKQWHE